MYNVLRVDILLRSNNMPRPFALLWGFAVGIHNQCRYIMFTILKETLGQFEKNPLLGTKSCL